MHRFLGIDPGLQRTGWGIIESDGNKLRYVDSGIIKTDSSTMIAERLLLIHNSLSSMILKYKPDFSAIEETYVNSNYGSSLKLSQARGAAILSISIAGLKPTEYSAKLIKKTIVGTGNAEKKQIMAMIGFLMPGVVIKDHDAADAIAIAICHASHYRAKI